MVKYKFPGTHLVPEDTVIKLPTLFHSKTRRQCENPPLKHPSNYDIMLVMRLDNNSAVNTS